MSRFGGLGVTLAGGWLILTCAVALLAPWLPLDDPARQNLLLILAPPGSSSWFGADSLGRDILARTVFGLRITFVVSLASVAIALVVGGALGIAAGFYRGIVERAILAGVNIVLAFPPLVLIIAMMSHPGEALPKVILALGIVFVPAVTRITRANVLLYAQREFVTAARAAGMGDLRLVLREILPNIMGPLLVYGMLLVAIAALAEAALSYLGLSVPAPTPTLGAMMASEQANVLEAPHAVFFPAFILFATIFALNFVGEHIQKRMDRRESAA